MSMAKNNDAAEVIKGFLHKAGLKATPARSALIAYMMKESEPVSLKYLEKKLASRADAVTVYRTIETLIKVGAVRRVDLQHGHEHYELTIDRPHHHHIVCEDCGTIEDIEACKDQDLEKSILKASSQFSHINHHSLEFFGSCKKCSKLG